MLDENQLDIWAENDDCHAASSAASAAPLVPAEHPTLNPVTNEPGNYRERSSYASSSHGSKIGRLRQRSAISFKSGSNLDWAIVEIEDTIFHQANRLAYPGGQNRLSVTRIAQTEPKEDADVYIITGSRGAVKAKWTNSKCLLGINGMSAHTEVRALYSCDLCKPVPS